MSFTEFSGDLDPPGGFSEFKGDLDPSPRKELPAGVKPSAAGAGRGSASPAAYARPAPSTVEMGADTMSAEFGGPAVVEDAPRVSVLQGQPMQAPDAARRLALGAGPISQQTEARAERMVDGQNPGTENRPVVERAAQGIRQQVTTGDRTTFGGMVERANNPTTQRLARDTQADDFRSIGEWATDTTTAVLSGGVSLTQMVPNIVAPGSALSETLDKAQRGLQDMESAPMKARRQQFAERIKSEKGFIDQYTATVAEMVTSPSVALQESLRQVAMFAGVLGAAKVGGMVAGGAVGAAGRASPTLALGEAISGGVIRAGAQAAGQTAGGVAASSTMAAGDAAGSAYEKLMALPDETWAQSPDFKELVAKGIAPEQAKQEIATTKARLAALMAAPLGLLGFMGAEASFARSAGAGAGRPMRTLATEMVTEPTEEALTTMAGNAAVQSVDDSQDITEGAGEAAGMATVTSAPFGGAAAINEMRSARPPVDRTEQIKTLRAGGDKTAADLLQRRQDREMSAFTTERETEALKTFGPTVQQRYRKIRLSGAKPGDAVTQTAMHDTFAQAAQAAGLSEKARDAALAKAATMEADKAPGFLQKALQIFTSKGLAQPIEGGEALATTIETRRDELLDAVLAADIRPTMAAIEQLEQAAPTPTAGVESAGVSADTLGLAVYQITKAPPYDGMTPMDAADADFQLEVMGDRAAAGTLTPEIFAASDIGRQIEMGVLTGIKQGLRTDPVGTINALRAKLSQSAEPEAVSREAETFGANDIAVTPDMDGEWQNFAPETGTLSIPRAEMPQIKSVHRGAMVNFLNARGVTHEQGEVDPASLKPTQAEFSVAKVQKASTFTGPERSILISADGHVLDGHHQWLAKRGQNSPVKVIRLNAPISELLPLVREFPSSAIDEATVNVQDAQAPAFDGATEAQAAPVETPAPAGGDAAAADQGIPAAGDTAAVEADGVDPSPGLASADEQRRASAEADKKRSDKRARLTSNAWDQNPMRAFLGKHGISMALANEFAPGPKERRQAMVPGYGPIFRKAGKNIDMLAEAAREEGFIQGEDTAELYDLIARVFRGEKVLPMFAEGVAEQEMESRQAAMQEDAQARFEDYAAQEAAAADDAFLPDDQDLLDAVGYNDADAATQAEFRALIAAAEAEGIDTETILEDAFYETREQPDDQYRQRATTDIQAARSQRRETAERARAEPGREATQPAGPEDGQPVSGEQSPNRPEVTTALRADGTLAVKGDSPAIRKFLADAGITNVLPMRGGVLVGKSSVTKAQALFEDPVLTAPTRADVEAQQDRADKATRDAAKKEADAKAADAKKTERAEVARRSEAAADTFELGQDPMANLTGQTDIFAAAPAPASPPSPTTAPAPDAELAGKRTTALITARKRLSILKSLRKCIG